MWNSQSTLAAASTASPVALGDVLPNPDGFHPLA